MSRKEMLRVRLDEAFAGSRFHSFLGSIQGVTDEQARWIPPHYRGFPHMDGSILNLAFHTGGDKLVMMSAMFGDRSFTWESARSRFEALGGDIAGARALAEEGHALVLGTLEALSESDLDAAPAGQTEPGVLAGGVFTIVAEHDLYHAGQIQYVRNLLAGRKRAGEADGGRR